MDAQDKAAKIYGDATNAIFAEINADSIEIFNALKAVAPNVANGTEAHTAEDIGRAVAYIKMGDMPSLEDSFGCDPWDEDNHGNHAASQGRGK